MPITCPVEIKPTSKAQFVEVDAIVMQCAFASHNHFGKLCEEKVYENDVADGLRAQGIEEVETQDPVVVSYQTFAQSYYLDLVVQGIVYELKAENVLSSAHSAQAIHYAALLGVNRIKLLNFGAEKVEGKLLGTPFAELDRYAITIDRERFRQLSPECLELSLNSETMFKELGGFLSFPLYNKALVEHLGGESKCLSRIPVYRNRKQVGTQPTLLHSDRCGFVVTTVVPKAMNSYEKHLHSLRKSLNLIGLQWINLHQSNVSFITIS